MKKIIRASLFAFITVMLLFGVSMTVMADESGELLFGEGEIEYYGSAGTYDMVSAAAVDEEATDYIVRMKRACAETIYLYDQGYLVKIEDLYSLMRASVYTAPDLFYVGNYYRYSYYSNGYVASVRPEYTMTGSELQKAKAQYEQNIEHITSQAWDLDTDLEKALFYHEYIVANFEYDSDYSIYDAYNMLAQRKGVCQAYTLLYSELLSREGIDNVAILSKGLNHVWNALEIEGSWYLADLTWDDPISGMPGGVDHRFFLRSADMFGHLLNDGTCDWIVTDGRSLTYSTRFDSAFWCNHEGWIHPYDGKVYYKGIDGSSNYVYNRSLESLTTENRMFSVNSRLYISGTTSYYPDALGFCGAGDKLYYANSSTHSTAYVYEYDLDTGESELVHTYIHTCSESECSVGITTLMPERDRVRYSSADIADFSLRSIGEFAITPYAPNISMDVNGDGAVTNSDIALYVRYLAGWDNIGFIPASADVNGDGRYNNRDVLALIRYLSV